MTNAPLLRSYASTLAGLVVGLAATAVMYPTVHASAALPTLTLTSLTQNAVVSGVVRLTARADTPGLTRMKFQVSGADLGQDIVAGPCMVDWNTLGLTDGFYTVSAVGYDAAGNSVQAPPVIVNVQNAASAISNVQATSITTTSAIVSWTTMLTADTQVEYGTSPSYGKLSPYVATLTTNHAQLLSGLTPGTTYHYRVRSKDWAGVLTVSGNFTFATLGSLSGGDSTVTLTPTPSPSPAPLPVSSCVTPDPFTAMGGGICYEGGWLPPGMDPSTLGSYPVSPDSGSAPVPDNSCTTPDPFTSMGGGTCIDGGWLPPGYVAPPPISPSQPSPSGPSAPSSGGSGAPCTTADPFLALGGGTCYNGGWLPPGMTPPTGGLSPSTGGVTAPSTPPPVSTPGACVGPDPFAAIPWLKGTCVNGGWVPTVR